MDLPSAYKRAVPRRAAERPVSGPSSADNLPSGEAWARSVLIAPLPRVEAELAERWPAIAGAPAAVRVTDLVDLRRGYWRTQVGTRIAPAHPAAVERGTRMHRTLGEILGPSAALEVQIARAGVVGQIDALLDVPIELKTTSQALPAEELLERRPEAVAQLVAYCALSERARGWLALVAGPDAGPFAVSVGEFEVGNPADRLRALAHEADRLRYALGEGSPASLPACRWYDHGCEFQRDGLCDCSGKEEEERSPIISGIAPGRTVEPTRAQWETAWNRSPVAPAPLVSSFRDLVYPRLAYMEATRGRAEGYPWAPTSELRRRLREVLEAGPVGEVARLLPRTEQAPDLIESWQGEPMLVRTTHAFVRPTPEEIARSAPQHALELGFRCAAVGIPNGRLVLGWERAPAGQIPFRVLRYHFEPLGTFSRMWRERILALEATRRDGRFERLAACPAWRARSCPYQPECGCPGGLTSR